VRRLGRGEEGTVRKIHVLIADDEMPAREELRFILGELIPAAVFHEATTGQEALDLVEREPIEVFSSTSICPAWTGWRWPRR